MYIIFCGTYYDYITFHVAKHDNNFPHRKSQSMRIVPHSTKTSQIIAIVSHSHLSIVYNLSLICILPSNITIPLSSLYPLTISHFSIPLSSLYSLNIFHFSFSPIIFLTTYYLCFHLSSLYPYSISTQHNLSYIISLPLPSPSETTLHSQYNV